MKQAVKNYIQQNKEETILLGEKLFSCPELGFKEFKTKELIIDYLTKHNLKVNKEFFETGFSVSIGNGKPHIGLIAELDAIPTVGHPNANKIDNAAHSCGHSTQIAIMLAALNGLNQQIDKLRGQVTLFFTPAEEFTDIEYRKKLVNKGKIKYLSGKQNMLVNHLFEECDLFIHLHSSSGNSGYRFSVNSTLAGFLYKKITFLGKAAHAAVSPDEGINALNMHNLFLNAVNMLRETFKEEDMVRVHGIIAKGGDTVNSIPEEVIYECYIRSANPNYLLELNEKISNAARCCSKALGGNCIIEDIPGYLPLIPSEQLSKVIYKNMLDYTDASKIKCHEKSIAAGDIGDVSLFKPVTQYGYTGFEGRVHGNNFKVADPDEVYIVQAKIVASSVIDLLTDKSLVDDIVNRFKPKMTYQQYLNYLNKGE
ncbi:MAG TPA: M20/M25/M40 family metallo-hydrolase [Erysipelotrichaceae bacterium]|nr:M20/M25/M40 family metallo-hydrolase [Erysipelotrichaceae bacterium]HQA85189.1 M20/M25/M40 family metallo-hydrolase [Erysipelotrichaceae bacterium]